MRSDDLYHRVSITRVGRSVLLFSLFICAMSASWAGSETGADFLKIPTSARPISLGNAYTALASGVDSIDRNVAGLGRGPAALAVSHQQIFGDNSLDYLAASWPGRTPSSFAWGLAVSRLSYADQERRGVDRSVSGSFGASDMSVGLSMARNLGSMQLGTQLKVIRQDLAGFSASGVAADVGLMTRTPLPRLSMGFAVRNIGPEMKFISENYHLPLTITAGAAYRMIRPLTLVLDIQNSPYSGQTTAALGFEFSAVNNVTLRAGYLNKIVQAVNNRQASETNRGNFGGFGGLAGGIGFKLGQFSIDYAISPFGELGTNHVFTLTTSFAMKDDSLPIIAAPKDERGIVIFEPSENTFGQDEPGTDLPK